MSGMKTQLAGHLLVDCLIAQGVTHAFGVPGESYLAVLDALHDVDIKTIVCRQEGGAAYMAEAAGKITGQPGIVMVTRGPGATNASCGIHVASQDSTPLIMFVGQVARDMKELIDEVAPYYFKTEEQQEGANAFQIGRAHV